MITRFINNSPRRTIPAVDRVLIQRLDWQRLFGSIKGLSRAGGILEPFESRVRESFGRQAFMTTLGAEIDCIGPGSVEIVLPFNPGHTQQDGFVHAGVITSILDSACGYAAYSVAPEGCNVLTVEFKVSLLAPAVGKKFAAKAQVKRRGKTLTICAADAFAINEDGEKLIATMLGTIMNLPNQAPASSVMS